MERQFVRSSNLRSVGYDESTNTLEIEFNSGSVYQYFNVPNHIYLNLMGAVSKGTYLHSYIKGRYRYERIR